MQLVRASFALLIACTTILEVSSHEIIQQLQVRNYTVHMQGNSLSGSKHFIEDLTAGILNSPSSLHKLKVNQSCQQGLLLPGC